MKLRLTLSILSFALLAACGGGGGEDPADKYVGIWKSVCYSYTATSGETFYTITNRSFAKASASELTGSSVIFNVYSDGACTKAVWTGYDEIASSLKLGSETTFVGKPAELIVLTEQGQSRPGYGTVENNQMKLVTYTPGGQLPAGWGKASPYTKQ